MSFLQEVARFWIYCSIFNITVVTFMQIKNPVCEKAHREIFLMHLLAGPISTIGGAVFLLFMTAKSLNR